MNFIAFPVTIAMYSFGVNIAVGVIVKNENPQSF
jgi:hypothetical protein